MVKLAANLTMLFNETPMAARFARARAVGFRYAEVLFPRDDGLAAVMAGAREAGLTIILANFAQGDRAAGDRGIAAHPGRVAEFRADVARAIEAAAALGCDRLHAMAGLRLPEVPCEEQWATFVANARARRSRRTA